jgi:phage gp37-like protein
MLIYADIEDAIIARVKAAQTAGTLGYRLAHIDSYGGEFDDDTFWTNFRSFPAVWVTIGGETIERLGRRARRATVRGAVMVGTRSARGERFARIGVTGEPGSYQIIDDVRQLVTGFGLVAECEAFEPGRVTTLYNTRIGTNGLSVLALEISTRYEFEVPEPPTGDAPEIIKILLNYRLQPSNASDDGTDTVLRPG